MTVETIGKIDHTGNLVRYIMRGDDRNELISHAEEWARRLGWGYSPSYSQPVEVEGGWEIYANRYCSCD